MGALDQGTVYVLKPGDHSIGVLHLFEGAPKDGAEPWAGVIDDGQGNLWGTARRGGAQDASTIYRIANGRLQVVHMFGKDPGGGRAPIGGLTLANDGMLYGVGREGGSPATATFMAPPAWAAPTASERPTASIATAATSCCCTRSRGRATTAGAPSTN
jgi:uncharacterized repeat protein (TIGR03803 family)